MSFTKMNMAPRWGHQPANQTHTDPTYTYKTHTCWMKYICCVAVNHSCAKTANSLMPFMFKKQTFICAFYHIIMSIHAHKTMHSKCFLLLCRSRWWNDEGRTANTVCDTVARCQRCHKLSHMNKADALCTMAIPHQLMYSTCVKQRCNSGNHLAIEWKKAMRLKKSKKLT